MNGDTHNSRMKSGRLPLIAAASLVVSGCMSVPSVEPYGDAPIDASSAAAAQISAEAAQPGVWPTFASIPETPADVRTPAEWNMAVTDTESTRAQLLAATAPSAFSLSGSEAFAQAIRAQVGFDPADIPTAADAAATEAFAAAMRARATPPPRPR